MPIWTYHRPTQHYHVCFPHAEVLLSVWNCVFRPKWIMWALIKGRLPMETGVLFTYRETAEIDFGPIVHPSIFCHKLSKVAWMSLSTANSSMNLWGVPGPGGTSFRHYVLGLPVIYTQNTSTRSRPGNILIRCPNNLHQLLPVQRVSELLTPFLRVKHTEWKLSLVPMYPWTHDLRWGFICLWSI